MELTILQYILRIGQFILILIGCVFLFDLIGNRKIVRNIMYLYYKKKEPFDEKNAALIISRTGIKRELLQKIYKMNYGNPVLHEGRYVLFSLLQTRGENGGTKCLKNGYLTYRDTI